jgi:hypothetical protein
MLSSNRGAEVWSARLRALGALLRRIDRAYPAQAADLSGYSPWPAMHNALLVQPLDCFGEVQ